MKKVLRRILRSRLFVSIFGAWFVKPSSEPTLVRLSNGRYRIVDPTQVDIKQYGDMFYSFSSIGYNNLDRE